MLKKLNQHKDQWAVNKRKANHMEAEEGRKERKYVRAIAYLLGTRNNRWATKSKVMERTKCEKWKDLLMIQNIHAHRSSMMVVISWVGLHCCFWNRVTNLYWLCNSRCRQHEYQVYRNIVFQFTNTLSSCSKTKTQNTFPTKKKTGKTSLGEKWKVFQV